MNHAESESPCDVRKTRCIEIARNLFVETCTCAAFMHRRKHADRQAK